jgi:hypothetical protein
VENVVKPWIVQYDIEVIESLGDSGIEFTCRSNNIAVRRVVACDIVMIDVKFVVDVGRSLPSSLCLF